MNYKGEIELRNIEEYQSGRKVICKTLMEGTLTTFSISIDGIRNILLNNSNISAVSLFAAPDIPALKV